MTNINNQPSEIKISRTLKAIDPPARIRILLAIGEGEACVCHLETILGLRQAFISQHLMALREVEILTARRAGRYIFYQLKDTRVLDLIRLTAELAGIPELDDSWSSSDKAQTGCCCPHCDAVTAETSKISIV
jgi:ArsR family transcriptional regulator